MTATGLAGWSVGADAAGVVEVDAAGVVEVAVPDDNAEFAMEVRDVLVSTCGDKVAIRLDAPIQVVGG